MKKTLLMAGAMLALTAGLAAAGGINLAWNDCAPGGLGSKTFACTSNNGANVLFMSAIAPAVMGQLNGHEGVLDLQTNQAALSDWWKIGGTGCRLGTAISSNFDFVAGPFSCVDVWAGQAAGGINYAYPFGAANRSRIRTVCAIPGSTGIDDATEYYIAKVTITNARTTGAGACAGCTDGACIVLNSIKLTQPAGVGDYVIANPITSNFVTWQSGGGLGGECPQATPSRNATWGSVKSLYR
jgi:hypothetical protein